MFMTFKDLAKLISVMEGKKFELNIAEISEVLSCMAKLEGKIYFESDKAGSYLSSPTDVIRELAMEIYHKLKLKETVIMNKKKESKKAQPKPVKKGSKKKSK